MFSEGLKKPVNRLVESGEFTVHLLTFKGPRALTDIFGPSCFWVF
jgi:hypothetical protein